MPKYNKEDWVDLRVRDAFENHQSGVRDALHGKLLHAALFNLGRATMATSLCCATLS